MDVYELIAAEASPEMTAKLIKALTDETETYRKAFLAAKAFIENNKETDEARLYNEYVEASKGL